MGHPNLTLLLQIRETSEIITDVIWYWCLICCTEKKAKLLILLINYFHPCTGCFLNYITLLLLRTTCIKNFSSILGILFLFVTFFLMLAIQSWSF
jgi:hypothetical protein